jgi:hypothetical protein
LIDCLAVWIVSVRRYPSKATAPRVKAHAIAVPATTNHCAFMAGLKQGSPSADFSNKIRGLTAIRRFGSSPARSYVLSRSGGVEDV